LDIEIANLLPIYHLSANLPAFHRLGNYSNARLYVTGYRTRCNQIGEAGMRWNARFKNILHSFQQLYLPMILPQARVIKEETISQNETLSRIDNQADVVRSCLMEACACPPLYFALHI